MEILHVIWKHGRLLVNFIPCKSNSHSVSFSAFGPKGHNARTGSSSSNCRRCGFQKGENRSASQRTDHCSEVGWQVSLQINILPMHIYGVESQVLTL